MGINTVGCDAKENTMNRLTVTFVVLAVCLVARQIPLPLVELTAKTGAGASYSLMALGVAPLLSAYMLVEFAALLVPAWRPLRVGSPGGRAGLHRVSLVIGIVLAFFQSVVMVTVLRTQGAIDPSLGTRAVVVLTLMGTTVAQIAMARWVDRDGLGNGFAVLLAGYSLPRVVDPVWRAFAAAEAHTIPAWVLPAAVVAIAVPVAAAAWMFSPYRLTAKGSEMTHPALISRPACGNAPLVVTLSVLSMIATVVEFFQRGGAADAAASPLTIPWGFSWLASIGAAFVFAYLFNPPQRLAAAWRSLAPNASGESPRLSIVLPESALFIAVVSGVYLLGRRYLGPFAPECLSVLLLTAVYFDLSREGRARDVEPGLVPVWEIHQTYALAPALRFLEAQDIRVVAQGVHLRALLQFFGPYVPIRLLVPREQATRAYALLQERWPR